jgi:phytanoyl-CoA hydroxylase
MLTSMTTIPQLSQDQISHFAATGYCTVREFFSAREIQGMRLELERFQREGKVRNVSTSGDGKTHSEEHFNLQICPLSNCSTLFRSLKWHDRVLSSVRALIGDPVIFRLDQIFLKPAFHGAGTNWHQDNAYWHQPHPERGVGMWVAMHDASLENGTIQVIPGSHDRLEQHVRDPGSDHHLHAPVVAQERAVPIELPAGGVLFFDWGTLHCTRANTTAHARAGLALHFRNGDYINEDFYGDPIIVPLTGATASDGRAEYGTTVAGTWERELDCVIGLAVLAAS